MIIPMNHEHINEDSRIIGIKDIGTKYHKIMKG